MAESSLRIGLGYDAHAFTAGRPLVLGGVTIPHPKGLKGHSDAGVLCHAIADALLGALSAGDIGQLFPDTDPQYTSISSLILLSRVRDLMEQKGARLVNVDAVLILEQPPVSEYFHEMRKNVAEALQASSSTVSIKATRNEGMGFIGRAEGVAAFAVALVTLGAPTV